MTENVHEGNIESTSTVKEPWYILRPGADNEGSIVNHLHFYNFYFTYLRLFDYHF